MEQASRSAHDAEQRMLGAVPGTPALGRGPAPDGEWSRHEYDHPAAGWGAARSVARVLERAGEPVEGLRALFLMNHEDGGFDCPGCAWPDDPEGLKLDICENGVKHVTWELQQATADREFFAEHTVDELAGWSDYDLEAVRAARRAAELRPGDRQVRADLVGGCVRAGRRNAAGAGEPEPGRRSTPPGGSATRPPSSTSCGCGSSARTTCRTARTCATRPAAGR